MESIEKKSWRLHRKKFNDLSWEQQKEIESEWKEKYKKKTSKWL